MRTLILLPSSESKAPGGSGGWDPGLGGVAAEGLATARTAVARSLASAMDDPATASRVTGVQGEAHRRAVEANRAAGHGPVLPAATRYRGVVWDHLEPASLGGAARSRARRSVLVVSALTGLAAWDEPVPDYKVKMSGRLAPLGVLATFWRAAVTDELARRAEAVDLILDLLPGDHARTVDFARVGAPTVHVAFTTATRLAAGHDAKAAKGRFARHLLVSAGDPRKAAAGFAWGDWVCVPGDDTTTLEVSLRP